MKKFIILTTLVFIIVFTIFLIELQKPPVLPAGGGEVINKSVSMDNDVQDKEQKYSRAKDFVNPSGFINVEEFKLADLIGKKVVLLDIWTYSCINCQRTLPFLTSWYDKYKDEGLEIIGVHSPEFEFEKERTNVEAAVKKFGIKYPVVMDNDFGTWRAYGNRYWPRKYLIDIDGFVIYDHIGEGGYSLTEGRIQEALAERKKILGEAGSISRGAVDVAEIKKSGVDSPEVYFGALRNEHLENGEAGVVGIQSLEAPGSIKKNRLYLDGEWNISEEYAENISGNARIIFKYGAKKVFMVASADAEIQLRIKLDGQTITSEGGVDILDGIMRVSKDSLYHIVESASPEEHVLEIEILSPGLKAFTFTFG